MEMRLLQNFIAIAREGGITAAARKANVTQPALSRQVKQLEDELGVALLERNAHSVKLTPAGELLAREAAGILAALDALALRVRSTAGGVELRVGYAPSLAADVLGPAIERFRQIHSGARVVLSDLSSAEMRAELAAGTLDAIISSPDKESGSTIDWTTLCHQHWKLAMPANHPAARKKIVRIGDLSGTPLLMFDREHYPDYWKQVTSYCKSQQWNPKVAGEFDSVTSIGAAVEANLGVAMVAGGSRIGDSARIRLCKLDPAPAPILVAAGRSVGRPANPALDVFVAELVAVAAGWKG